jgi:hypothetical protein
MMSAHPKPPISRQPGTPAFYAVVALVAALLAFLVGSYLFTHLDALVANAFGDQAYYLLLLFLALVCAVVLFGVLRSIGSAQGQLFGAAFEFGGPAALFVFVILAGGFLFKGKQTDFPLTIKLRTDDQQTMEGKFGKDAIVNSSLLIDLGPLTQPVKLNGDAVGEIQIIPFRFRKTPIGVSLDSKFFVFKEPKSAYPIPDDAVLTLIVVPKPKKTIQARVQSSQLFRITSGGTSDGHSPFCQPRTVRGCVLPQHGGRLVPGSGNVVDLQRNSDRGKFQLAIKTPDQICMDFMSSTGACETEIYVQGYVSAVEEFEDKS